MLFTENNGQQMWSKMLKENFNVTDAQKLDWVSQYAAIHEIHEAALGVGGANLTPNPATNAGNGVNPLYATPLNTTGMGNPMAPGYGADGQVPMGASADFFRQAVGSGDIPVSTLPMALNIALTTVGFELVPVIPSKGPWAMLSYMDFPYAGGKLGRRNEIVGLDGRGEGAENKPLYVKLLGGKFEDPKAARAGIKEGDDVTCGDLKGTFKCFGRMDGGIIVAVKESGDVSVKEAVEAVSEATIGSFTYATAEAEQGAERECLTVDFAQTMVDFVDGFANFATQEKRPMSRAENETGTGNVIGLRLFSKWVQMGAYEVTATVTRQQLQDLPLYGVDAVAKVMEACQNEITQSINARILEHVFALGVTNANNQKFRGVDLNLYLGSGGANTTIADMGYEGKLVDIYGEAVPGTTEVTNFEVTTSAENLYSRQRRIASRILAAANVIQVTGRRGRPTWVVTNAQVVSALQDCSQFVYAPMANTLAQDGSNDLYFAGTLAGLKVYVDPYMDWDDCRVCVGRKGNGNEPGVVFMPYILADTVSITAEGTMAPKMLVNSRYALADAGFYPETMYFTFVVGSEFGII